MSTSAVAADGLQLRAVDYGIALVVPSTSGLPLALTGDEREAWLANPALEVVSAEIPPPSGSTIDVTVRLSPRRRIPVLLGLQTGFALLCALLAGHGPRGTARLLALVSRKPRGNAAAKSTRARVEEVEARLFAVRQISTAMPARVLPLHEAAAAALLLGDRRPYLCYGVTIDPLDTHAWLELDGQPIAETPTVVSRFTKVLELDL